MAGSPKVACPEGQKSLMTLAEYEAATAGYRNLPSELDPTPDDRPLPSLPQPDFLAAWRRDRSLPLEGRARAEVLLAADGSIVAVLVPCATSKKAVKPIVEALMKARGNVPTRNGVPVKHLFVVPIGWRIG